MLNETFKTHITFWDAGGHIEDTPASKLVDTITRLVQGPAAQMGMIKEVRIVDNMDCTVFLANTPSRFEAIKVLFPKSNKIK